MLICRMIRLPWFATLPGMKVATADRGKAATKPKRATRPKLSKRAPGEKCNSRKADGSGYCGQAAGHGTSHPGKGRCSKHGGSTKLGTQGALVEVAKDLVEVYGLPKKVDPHTALMQELERTAGHVSWLFIKVQEVGKESDADLVGPVGNEGVSRETGLESHPSVEPNVWLRLYQEERKHLAKVARDCIAAGIEERRVEIAESQGMLIARAIQGILKALGVADDPRAPKVVRQHLVELREGSEPQ